MKFIASAYHFIKNIVSIGLLAVLAMVVIYSIVLSARIIDPAIVDSSPEGLNAVASFLFSLVILLNPVRFQSLLRTFRDRIAQASR